MRFVSPADDAAIACRVNQDRNTNMKEMASTFALRIMVTN